jgi:hypothetical protein
MPRRAHREPNSASALDVGSEAAPSPLIPLVPPPQGGRDSEKAQKYPSYRARSEDCLQGRPHGEKPPAHHSGTRESASCRPLTAHHRHPSNAYVDIGPPDYRQLEHPRLSPKDENATPQHRNDLQARLPTRKAITTRASSELGRCGSMNQELSLTQHVTDSVDTLPPPALGCRRRGSRGGFGQAVAAADPFCGSWHSEGCPLDSRDRESGGAR